MSMPPEMNEVPLDQFDPEQDLKPAADFVDMFLMGEGGEMPAEGQPPMEGMPPEGGDVTAQIVEIDPEMDAKEKKDIKAANKQLVMDNVEAFIEKIRELGPPNKWPKDMGLELKRALQLAWGQLDSAEKKAITSGQEAGPADPYADYNAEVEKMLAEA